MKCKHCSGEVREVRKLPYKSKKSKKKYQFYRCDQCGIAFPVARAEFDVNSPRLVYKGHINWKCKVPGSFPCFLCGEGRGEFSLHYSNNGVLVKLVVCGECVNLPVETVVERFEGAAGE